jgi:long-subunit fatty acid transport protein
MGKKLSVMGLGGDYNFDINFDVKLGYMHTKI